MFEQTDSVVFLSFENVPLDKLDQVEPLLRETLEKVIADKVDTERMKVIVERRISEHQSQIEQSPHEAAVGFILGDFLYGDGEEDVSFDMFKFVNGTHPVINLFWLQFKSRMNIVPFFESLKTEGNEFWSDMLRAILDGVWVVVKGRPSIELQTRMAKEEADRIQSQVDRLGKEGLQNKEAILNKSMAHNEIPVPDSLLQNFEVFIDRVFFSNICP